MNTNEIIVMLGLKGSGKDTFATKIGANTNHEKFAFALPLKQVACQVFNCDIDTLEDRQYKEETQTLNIESTTNIIFEFINQFFKTLDIDIANVSIKNQNIDKKYISESLLANSNVENELAYSPRDMQRFLGSVDLLRGCVVNGVLREDLLTHYLLKMVEKSMETTEEIILTDARMPVEAQLTAELNYKSKVVFNLVVRYIVENNTFKSYSNYDGHWTETMNANLTNGIIDFLNKNKIKPQDLENNQEVQKALNEEFAMLAIKVMGVTEYKNIQYNVILNKQMDNFVAC